jgi:hypothetical protein
MSYLDNIMINREPDKKVMDGPELSEFYDSYYKDDTELTYFNETDSSEEIVGGAIITEEPHGGFPQLFQCEKETGAETTLEDDEIKKREMQTSKISVNIRDILSARRDVKPFFAM